MNDATKNTASKPDVPEEILASWQRIVDLVADLAGVPTGVIMRIDSPQIEVFLASATEGNPYRKGERAELNTKVFYQELMKEPSPLLIPNALKNLQWDQDPDLKLGMGFYLVYPVRWPDGEIFGVICVLDKRGNPRATLFKDLISEFQQVAEADLRLMITAGEREKLLIEFQRYRDKLMKMFAEQTSELEKSKAELEERLRFENLISYLSANFIALPPEGVEVEIALALTHICDFFGADDCGFMEVIGDLKQVDSVNIYSREGRRKIPMSLVASRYPWAYHKLVEKKEPVIFSSLKAVPSEASESRALLEQAGIHAMLMLPLSLIGDEVTHLIGLWSSHPLSEWPSALNRRLGFLGETLAITLLQMRSQDALLKTEQSLAEVQCLTHLGSWYWDLINQVHQWSDQFYRIFGLAPREVKASYEAFLARVHPDDRASVDQANREAISGPDKPYSLQYRVVRPDGSERIIDARGTVVFDQHSRAVGMIGMLQDITERKHVEEELPKAFNEIKRLKEKMEAENIYLQKRVEVNDKFEDVIGAGNPINYVMHRIQQVAPTGTTVLLLGETGTGKGLFARALHRASGRKDKPFVNVNCAGLPPNLIESELFGREKGAFTGSTARQIGRFELANGGTIFLDEIGELPTELQAKLLKVIEDGEFERLGSPHPVKVDIRIIASTNRNLEEEIAKGRFRKDLFYRLNVFPITIPPLRQRREDIPLLVKFYVESFGKKHGKRIEKIPKTTMTALRNYAWPGNVRELINVIERAVIVSEGPGLRLAEKIDGSAITPIGEKASEDPETREIKGLVEVEREHIRRTVQEAGWKIEGPKGAAQLLGMNPSTLKARMRKLGIKRPTAD